MRIADEIKLTVSTGYRGVEGINIQDTKRHTGGTLFGFVPFAVDRLDMQFLLEEETMCDHNEEAFNTYLIKGDKVKAIFGWQVEQYQEIDDEDILTFLILDYSLGQDESLILWLR